MADDLMRHFFGGFVRMHILYHASKEPIWGLEMMEELRRHGYRLGPGTLYPILHQLEAAGFLNSKLATVAGKRRKNYQATRAGRNSCKAPVKSFESWCRRFFMIRMRWSKTKKNDASHRSIRHRRSYHRFRILAHLPKELRR